MFFSNTLNTFLCTLAVSGFTTAATTHRVEVGNNGALTFNPNSTVAAVGDVVEFFFYPKNHSVVQSTFKNPCQSDTGFFSGFIPVASGQGNRTFSVTVNDTKPIWFYCSQPGAGGHCAKGMVGCVNCPTSNNTLDAFAAAAKKTTNATVTQPHVVGGGVFAANSDASGYTPSSSGSQSPSATSSPASRPSSAATSLVATRSTIFTLAAGLVYLLC